MTPPRPTAPTAAELRADIIGELTADIGSPRSYFAKLDDLMAAVRAEALWDAAREVECRGPTPGSPDLVAAADRIRALVSK